MARFQYNFLSVLFIWSVFTFSSCRSDHKEIDERIELSTKESNLRLRMEDNTEARIIDSVVQQKETFKNVVEPAWKGPILPINYHDVGILKEYFSRGDTLPLDENVKWVKSYLKSDSLYSFGSNGILLQSFTAAVAKSPNGDCNRQVVLELLYPEKRGYLVGKEFYKGDSIQFFTSLQKGKNYFGRNFLKQEVYDSIFGLKVDTIRGTVNSYYCTNNGKFLIHRTGESQVEYNEGLQEQRIYSYNNNYRIAYFQGEEWIVSNWTPCIPNAESPSPTMACFSQSEIIITWAFSEGMGDMQLFVSKVVLSGDTISFENGKVMQGYIGLGCD